MLVSTFLYTFFYQFSRHLIIYTQSYIIALKKMYIYRKTEKCGRLTVELFRTLGITPTVERGTESQDDLLRRRKQHIALLNALKSSINRALSRFITNSTAIFGGRGEER